MTRRCLVQALVCWMRLAMGRSSYHHHHYHYHHRRYSLLGKQKEKWGHFLSSSQSPSNANDDNEERRVHAAEQQLLAHRLHRSAKSDDRIGILEEQTTTSSTAFTTNGSSFTLTRAEQAELKGLYQHQSRFEEQYNSTLFTQEHLQFKHEHNVAFAKLIHYCLQKQKQSPSSSSSPCRNVFYLDGPTAGTTRVLLENSRDQGVLLESSNCYTANRHWSTCQQLHQSLPMSNVIHASAITALIAPTDNDNLDEDVHRHDDTTSTNPADSFADIPFVAYYLDGCGGYAPAVIAMLEAALHNHNHYQKHPLLPALALGFSLVGGGRDVVDKEVQVIRSVVQWTKRQPQSCRYRVSHVWDDPERYGVDPSLEKVAGGTLTTWLVLEREM